MVLLQQAGIGSRVSNKSGFKHALLCNRHVGYHAVDMDCWTRSQKLCRTGSFYAKYERIKELWASEWISFMFQYSIQTFMVLFHHSAARLKWIHVNSVLFRYNYAWPHARQGHSGLLHLVPSGVSPQPPRTERLPLDHRIGLGVSVYLIHGKKGWFTRSESSSGAHVPKRDKKALVPGTMTDWKTLETNKTLPLTLHTKGVNTLHLVDI